MKNLAAVAVSLFVSAQLRNVNFITGLMGKWKFDSIGPNDEIPFVFKRLGTKRFVYKSTLAITG